MRADLVTLVALVATCLSMASSIPQLRRTWRTAQITGVSLAACALGAVTEACWAIYGFERHLWGAIPAAVMMTIANATLALMLVRRGARGVGATLLAALGWAGALVNIAVWAGIHTLGSVIGLAYVVQAGPTIWTVTRTGAPAGVSRARWWLVAAEAVSWGSYGLAQGDPATCTFGVVGLTTAVLMLAHTAPSGAPTRRSRNNLNVGSSARSGDGLVGLNCVCGGGHVGLVFDGRQSTERTLSASSVVSAFDPGNDRCASIVHTDHEERKWPKPIRHVGNC